jgi:glyoxylase-like metal-dependent hydrolase (beta-lactamase superfamily II)
MIDMSASDVTGLPAAPEVFQIEVGLLQNFCEILYCPDTKEAAVVDPAWEVDTLLREAKRLGVRITKILVTHTHNDHIEGVEDMVAATNATVVIHPNEEQALPLSAQARLHVRDRLDVAIGNRGVRALETPGHTVGGTCYLADGYIVTGDVLFVGGCGRTDFTGGNTAEMWKSLQRLAALPEETRVYPGHNYGSTLTSTISRELAENRFLLCKTFEDFKALRERKRT